MTMNRPKKKRKMVSIYDPADILAGKENPRKIGEMSDPDEPAATSPVPRLKPLDLAPRPSRSKSSLRKQQ